MDRLVLHPFRVRFNFTSTGGDPRKASGHAPAIDLDALRRRKSGIAFQWLDFDILSRLGHFTFGDPKLQLLVSLQGVEVVANRLLAEQFVVS